MTHYPEDDLILYYYGEGGRARADITEHLHECDGCRASYETLTATLDLASQTTVPSRGDQYGLEVWQRIATDLKPRHLERIVSRTLALTEIPDAFQAYIDGNVVGRTVVKIGAAP